MKKTFQRFLFPLLLCLGFWMTSLGQAPQEKTILWEISGKDLPHTSYLFGTIHLLCPEEIKFSPVLKEKWENSQKLYLELDLSNPSLPSKMMAGALMKNDTTLNDLWDPETYEILEKKFLDLTGMPLGLLAKMKPTLLHSLLMAPLLGCQPSGWEQVLLEEAQNRSIAIEGLESLEQQLMIFDQIPYQEQALQLQHALLEQDSLRDAFYTLLNIYRSQDLPKMVEMIYGDASLSVISAALLDDRNQSWIPKIIEGAQAQPSFFAVGAGHLGGEQGVIALLRAQGYTVKPLLHQPQ
jgi:uncharacterized protein YbaP (TraB family)